MPIVIEEIRTKTCLHGFRCGLDEIDKFCKKAHKQHSLDTPLTRIRVMYDGDSVMGMHSLSVKAPDPRLDMLDRKTIYTGKETFLYLDHFAIDKRYQGKHHSDDLMSDVLEVSAQTLSKFGRIYGLALNAANESAKNFFTRWAFVNVSHSTTPFMTLPRASVLATYEALKSAKG